MATRRREPRNHRGGTEQGRQDSNLQPPVLETGALPIELRPLARTNDCSRALFQSLSSLRGVPLGILFMFLCVCMLGVGYAAARAGGGAWVIAVAAVAIALWLGNAGIAMLRRSHR